jgi:hypothetical protein
VSDYSKYNLWYENELIKYVIKQDRLFNSKEILELTSIASLRFNINNISSLVFAYQFLSSSDTLNILNSYRKHSVACNYFITGKNLGAGWRHKNMALVIQGKYQKTDFFNKRENVNEMLFKIEMYIDI